MNSDTPENEIAPVEVRSGVALGFRFGIGIFLAFALIVGASLVAARIVIAFVDSAEADNLRAEMEQLDAEAAESKGKHDAWLLEIAADAGMDTSALANDRSALDKWGDEIRDRIVNAKPHQKPWFPTERERQRNLEIPALALGRQYSVPKWFKIVDEMCEDPDGVKDALYSLPEAPFVYLGIENYKSLVFFKVRAYHSNEEIAPLGYIEGYVPASEFGYQRPQRVGNE